MESIGFKNKNIIENHIWKSTESNEFRYGDIFQVDVIFSK